MSAPSGIFGLSVFWAWAIPLALAAVNVLMILLIRRDYRRHDAEVAALYARQAALTVDCTADTRRAMLMGAEAGARVFGGNPYIDAPSAPSREAYEAFLATRTPPVDDASFLRSLGIASEADPAPLDVTCRIPVPKGTVIDRDCSGGAVMPIYDDIASDKPEGDTLTLEKLAEAVAKLRSGGCLPPRTTATWSSPWRAEPLFGLRIFVSDVLPARVPRKLTRWERFRVWVEDLADRADVYYHHPRVQRTEPAKALLIGRDLYIPRAAAAVLGPFTS